jgi:hypothetical protein
LRFSDGAYVSLQPDTQFRVDEYRYDGKTDGSERGFFSLVKGGLRTITGLVGRVNKRNYQISTTVATIGIRGTEFTLSMNGGLSGNVGEGEIQVCNVGGCLPVTSGQSFTVVKPDAKPAISAKKSDLPPAQPTNAPAVSYISGNDVTDSGLPPKLSPFKDGPGYTLVFAKQGGGGPAGTISSGSATFDANSGLVSYTLTSGTYTRGSVTVAKNIQEGFITFGRWDAQYVQNGVSFSLLGNQAFHYVVGIPTPQAALVGTATYTMLGSSGPTGDNNLPVGKVVSASLSADFSLGKVSTAVNFQYGGANYFLSSNTLTINRATSTFSGSVTTSGCAAGTGCGGSMVGVFSGPNADAAGLAYNVSDFSGGTFNVGGVIAFKKQ